VDIGDVHAMKMPPLDGALRRKPSISVDETIYE